MILGWVKNRRPYQFFASTPRELTDVQLRMPASKLSNHARRPDDERLINYWPWRSATSSAKDFRADTITRALSTSSRRSSTSDTHLLMSLPSSLLTSTMRTRSLQINHRLGNCRLYSANERTGSHFAGLSCARFYARISICESIRANRFAGIAPMANRRAI